MSKEFRGRFVSAAAILVLALVGLAKPQEARVIAFVDVALVPMDRERVVPNQVLIVRESRIAAIGDVGKVEIPPGAVRIEGRGRYLLPGLAEMHVHLPEPPTSQALIDDVLFLFVANGVTVARGMMGHPSHVDLRDRVARGDVLGPSLYVAGPPLDPSLVPNAQQAREVVRAQAAQGFDLIKVIDVDKDVYQAIIDTAGELKIPVAGHVPRAVGVHGALAARQRTIEHLDGYVEALEPEDSPIRNADFPTRSRQLPLVVDTRKIDALVAETRDRGVANVPTLGTYEAFFSPERGEVLRSRHPELRYLPAKWVDEWVARKNEFLDNPARNVMGFAITGPGAARLLQVRKQLVRALVDGRAMVLLGTDALQLFAVPGFSVHTEMALMADAGISPFAILKTATRNVAEHLGALSEFGTIEVGRRADLLLLEHNPLKDVRNASRPAGVMIRGRWMPEADIQKRLERIAAAHAG